MSRRSLAVFSGLLLFSGIGLIPGREEAPRGPEEVEVNTFSLVAYDPEQQEWGVAVASKYLAVGAAVPWARAGAGALATQSLVNITYGPRGLDLLAEGLSAEEVVKKLTEADKGKEHRQLGVVDAQGRVASFTGKRCHAWAGDHQGKHYACQGNLLKGEAVIEALSKSFEDTGKEHWPLAWRLQEALEAGEKAGGDRRGKQSAALLVVREGAGPNGLGDRYLDFRVDDHSNPVQELGRILALRLPRPTEP